jgi:glyoxylase-like metal-dependent hydrolase (beta-lactamase superfamily II)
MNFNRKSLLKRQNSIICLSGLLVLSSYTLFTSGRFIFAQPESPVQTIDTFIKTEKLNDKTILVRMGYDAVTAIETQKGIVVIDAGISTGLTSKYRKIIENEFKQKNIAYLINTHGHPDHTGGNTVFADAVIIGHEYCADEISKQWQDTEKLKSALNKIVNDYDKELQTLVPGTNEWENVFCQKTRYQYAYNDVLSNCPVTKPSMTFNDSLDLDMGDVKFNLVHFGSAHSGSDIIVYIQEKKTLMVGDLFSRYGRPGFNENKIQNGERRVKVTKWIEKRLSDIDIIIDGHGQILSKDDLKAFNSLIKEVQEDK